MNIKNFDSEIQALYDEVLTTRTTMSSSYINACNRFIRRAKRRMTRIFWAAPTTILQMRIIF